LGKYPNLDFFGKKEDMFGRVAKTSLGNTLRIIKSLIIIDEGHKAYSETARDTISNFNPSLILELSATPPQNSNILINIHGQELNREEMIKLDLNIVNKASVEWKDTLLAAIEKRKVVEKKAKEYKANTGEYIRPICLIQVERTGKEQRGKGYIHSEGAKEYLIKQCGIAEEEIAIKSSEKDDIEGIDLLSKDCPIRFIITKQALQEGWDCAFAYILVILTNPSSQLSITQLVGRILRQPKARKTKIKELDESYVFCFRQKARDLLGNIKSGFEAEGLGDLASRITVKEGDNKSEDDTKEKTVRYRDRFKPYEGHIYLPKFVMQANGSWRNVNYEMDILSRIDWTQVETGDLKKLSLSETKTFEDEIAVGLSDDEKKVITEKKKVSKAGGLEIDSVFVTRQLMDIVPNPWVAYEIGKDIIDALVKKHGKQKVSNNLVFIIEEIRRQIDKEKDRLSELIFRDLIRQRKLFFFLLVDRGGYELPSSIKVKRNTKALIRDDNTPVQRSLFDFMAEEEFNETEKAVAIYLDEQERLLWWYRNLSRQDYFIQGWRMSKVYPDFVFSTPDSTRKDYSKVYVVETKGIHLKDNDDTRYKKSIFKFCNELGKQREWQDIHKEFSKGVEFQVIAEDEWKKRINEIFEIN